MDAETLLIFTLASTLLSIAPGPDNVFVLMHSALYGRKSGILITLGLCTGLVGHTLLVIAGLATVIQTSALAFTILKTCGVIYLLYLAWQMFHVSVNHLTPQYSAPRSGLTLYRRGILMNIGNPKVSIFFLAFLPQFTSAQAGNLTRQLVLLAAIFMVVALIVFIAIALLAGFINNWLKQSPQKQQMLSRLSGCVFVIIAFQLAMSSLS